MAHLAAQLTTLGHQVWVLNLAEVPERRQDGQVTVLTGRASAQVAEIITFPRLGATTVVARFLGAHR